MTKASAPFRITAQALLASLWLATAVCGQTGESAAPSPAKPSKLSYRISSADRLSVTIVGEADLVAPNKRVDANGNVSLALVGEVHVGGLTVSEAQAAIETAYRENRILRKPQVAISVDDYSPREVNIAGWIRSPGKYPILPEKPLTLQDLIIKAGGFSDSGNGTRIRISRTQPDGTVKIIVKDVEAKILSRPTKNDDGSFILEPGDLVFVPQNRI